MNKQFSYILSGIIGGALVLAGNYFILPKNEKHNLNEPNYVKQVNENIAPVTGPDFTLAADKGLQVVVQINAQESDRLVKQKEEESLKQNPFFNDPMFRQFDLRSFGFGMPFYQPKKGSGSGVIYSQDGYIVTNNHVVEFADEIEVILKDGKKYNAKKVGTDPRTDLAVLKIEASNLPTLEIGNSDNIKVGEWVLAVGNPYGYLTSTVTAGIVSAKGRDLDIINQNQEDDYGYFNPYQQKQGQTPAKGIEEYIQTDAAVNPGNSGGALVDANGRLVGINSAIFSRTGSYAGYSFAIPVNLMKKVINELIKNGTFERGRLGIQVANVDEEFQKQLNLNSENGVVIEKIEEKSSAQSAGLLPNDVIIGINGKEVKNFDDLQKIVGLTNIGETLTVKIIRDGVTKDIPVRIKRGI